MKILTETGERVSITGIPQTLSDKRHFAVLHDNDFHFRPLIFLEVYKARQVTVQLGNHRVGLPADFSILVYDRDNGLIEAIELGMATGFDALAFNPLRGLIPESLPMVLHHDRDKREWMVPKFPNNCALAVSVAKTCIYICRGRWPEMNISDILNADL